MDDRTANFEAVQYAVKYSNFNLNDKLLNLLGKMNNAVQLILNPFPVKGKMLCRIWIEQCSSCSWNLGFKKPDLKIWKNVIMDYFNEPSLDLTWGKEEYLQVGWHIWSGQDQKMLHLKYHSRWIFITFHEFMALEFNYV